MSDLEIITLLALVGSNIYYYYKYMQLKSDNEDLAEFGKVLMNTNRELYEALSEEQKKLFTVMEI